MLFVTVVIGGLLLLFGRKLFWFFVAACGFAGGLTIATRWLSVRPEWLAFLIALGAGVLGALLAVFFQRLAIGVGGFLAGAFITVSIAGRFGFEGGAVFWAAFVVGGIVGAMLMAGIFDWGLILLSCLSGSSLIVEAFRSPQVPGLMVWAGLLVTGVAVQAAMMRHEKR